MPNVALRLRIIWNWSNVFCIVSPALVLVTPFIVKLLQTIQKMLWIIQTGLINFRFPYWILRLILSFTGNWLRMIWNAFNLKLTSDFWKYVYYYEWFKWNFESFVTWYLRYTTGYTTPLTVLAYMITNGSTQVAKLDPNLTNTLRLIWLTVIFYSQCMELSLSPIFRAFKKRTVGLTT